MTSERRTDTFDNPSKQGWRDHTMRLLRSNPALWDSDFTKLRCDVAELLGESGDISIATYGEILRPGGYTGIDTNSDRVRRFSQRFPLLKFKSGDIRHNTSYLCTKAQVGMLNLDGYLEVAGSETRAMFASVRPIIQRGIQLFSSFILMSNNCLDSTHRNKAGKPGYALRRHVEGIVEELEGYVPLRALRIEDLLPYGAEQKVNKGYEGPIGAFYIYRGKPRGFRMASLGLVL
jgi:hypothetical protein